MGGEKREKRKRNNNLDITLVQLIRCYQALNEKTLRERCGQVGRTGEVKLLFQLCLGHPFHLAVENRVPAWSANIPQTKKKKDCVNSTTKLPPPKKNNHNQHGFVPGFCHSRFAFGGVDARVCFQGGGQQVGAHHHRFTGPLATFKLLPFHFGLQKYFFSKEKKRN